MNSLYSKIGPVRLRQLVDAFYERVFENEKLSPLFKTDKSVIRDKQYKFLTQFLGGPQLYTMEYGHPKMRMRHLPHVIDSEAKDEWLKCMKEAIQSMDFEDGLDDALYNCFPAVAAHMQNH